MAGYGSVPCVLCSPCSCPTTCHCSCHYTTSYCTICGKPPMYCTCAANAYNAPKYPTVYSYVCPRCLGNPCQCGYMQGDLARIYKLIEDGVQERLKAADKPVLTECFVGYRVWHYNAGYLQSAYKKEYNWPHRKAISKDVYDNAGIHAVKEYKGVIPLLESYCWPSRGPSVSDPMGMGKPGTRGIAGAVYMWGEVVEHTSGYLAEFAYPKELYVDETCDILTIMQLEENYGVPVSIRAELNPEKNSSIEDALWGRKYYFTYSSGTLVPAHGLVRKPGTTSVPQTIPPPVQAPSIPKLPQSLLDKVFGKKSPGTDPTKP